MATISSLGVGSGIDAESIVSKLMALERQPLTAIQKKESGINAKISAYGTLSGLLDSLRTASNTLGTPNSLAAFKATSSATDVLKGTGSSTASAGTYAINVLQLATAHKTSHTTAIAGDAGAIINSTGTSQTFSLSVGGATATDLTINANASLADLRDAINNSAAGVSANIVTNKINDTTSESRLVLTAKEAGKSITTSTTLAGFGSFQTLGGENGHDAIKSNTAFSGGAEILGKGKLNITVGSGVPVSVDITTANATLSDIATQITSSGAGVTASVVTDTTGTHLKLVANSSDQKISYTAEDTDGADGYNFSRLNGFSDAGDPLQLAQSAKLTVEGFSITSTSNNITTAIKGVTLDLTKTGSTTLTVERDREAAKNAVDTFVSAYNTLNNKIRSLTAYDSTNKTANTLTGDATVRNLQSQLTSILIGTPGTPSGSFSQLNELGITMGPTGNLSVDSTKFQNAVDKDFASVSDVLDRYGSSLYTKIGEFTSTNGLLAGKTNSLSLMLKDYSARKESMELRFTAIEKRYRSQFSALDGMIGKMQTTSTFLTQQIARL